MLKSSIRCKTIVAVIFAFLFSSSAIAQEPVPESSLSMVPSNAMAFIHVNCDRMVHTPGMVVLADLASGVKNEADALFQRHLGIRISELKQVTYVMPTLESFMSKSSNGEIAGFGLITFARSIEASLIADRLPGNWRPAKIGNLTVFESRDNKHLLFQCSANTIAFGSNDGIQWFIDNRDKSSSDGLRFALESAKFGHVTLGINGDEVPAEMKMFVPPAMKSIVNAKSASFNFNFSEGIAVNARMNFKSEGDAFDAASFLKANVEETRNRLELEEANALRRFNAEIADWNGAVEPLGMLAIIRYGDKILEEAYIDQSSDRVEANLAIEGLDANMLVITCLTAVQAIGTSAEAQFEAIADELN